MKIAVCVKQVLDTTVPLVLGEGGKVAQAEPQPLYILNPADRAALEAALVLRARVPGSMVTALSAGGSEAEEALRLCLARGADAAIHLTDAALAGIDARGTALVLSRALAPLNPDLVLCGDRTLEGGTALVGPYLAEALGFSQVSAVVRLDADEAGRTLRVERRLERGWRQPVTCPLPTVLIVETGVARPRYIPVRARRRASAQPLHRLDLAALGLNGEAIAREASGIRIGGLSYPRPRAKKMAAPDSRLSAAERMRLAMTGGTAPKAGSGSLVEGPPEVVAERIVRFLAEQGLL